MNGIIPKNQLDLFRDYINKNLGIYISRDKDYLLESKLDKLLRISGINNYKALYYHLESGDKYALDYLTKCITTNHTFFFRENTHMEILMRDVLKNKKDNIIIWDAASSTGEEAYSIAITLIENSIYNFKIIASDIDKSVLIHLKKAVYHKDRLKEVNPYILDKYFLKTDENEYFKVKDVVRGKVIAKQINLVENIKFTGKYDYIFCRNVMIYFDKTTQKNVVSLLLKNLSDNGLLFVGHSECLFQLNECIESPYLSVYKKKRA